MSQPQNLNFPCLALIISALLCLSACSHRERISPLSGTIAVDGSSTIQPITKRIAEEFDDIHQRVRVKNSASGSACGIRKFALGSVDVAVSSRALTAAEQRDVERNGMKVLQLPIAFDGITVVVNHSNNFASDITVEELARVWKPGSHVRTWSEIRPEWPNRPVHLYGTGPDSGTFEFFNSAVDDKELQPLAECNLKPDNGALIDAIAKDTDGLGYVGFGHYRNNRNYLKALAVKSGNTTVFPSIESIRDGQYKPLSRPLYLLASSKSMARPAVVEFLRFYLERAPDAVSESQYVPLHATEYETTRKQLETFALSCGVPAAK